jgi:hypothetical protein
MSAETKSARPPDGDLRAHFDWVAANNAHARRLQQAFHAQLRAHFRHHIPEGERVL